MREGSQAQSAPRLRPQREKRMKRRAAEARRLKISAAGVRRQSAQMGSIPPRSDPIQPFLFSTTHSSSPLERVTLTRSPVSTSEEFLRTLPSGSFLVMLNPRPRMFAGLTSFSLPPFRETWFRKSFNLPVIWRIRERRSNPILCLSGANRWVGAFMSRARASEWSRVRLSRILEAADLESLHPSSSSRIQRSASLLLGSRILLAIAPTPCRNRRRVTVMVERSLPCNFASRS